jgi:hypothetical protein
VEQIMKLKGPVVTLLGGLVVAGVLFGLSVAAAKTNNPATNAAGNASAAAPSASAQPGDAKPSASTSATPAPDPAAAAPITFAGKVNGGAATLAIAIKEGKAIAYLCNGRNLESWMQGDAANGQLSLTGTQQATLTATYDGNVATGTVTAAGRTYQFQIKPAQAPSGLYRLATTVGNAQVVNGWIVSEGQVVGLTTRTQDGKTTTEPAPEIDPNTGIAIIDGTPQQVGRVDGTTPLR